MCPYNTEKKNKTKNLRHSSWYYISYSIKSSITRHYYKYKDNCGVDLLSKMYVCHKVLLPATDNMVVCVILYQRVSRSMTQQYFFFVFFLPFLFQPTEYCPYWYFNLYDNSTFVCLFFDKSFLFMLNRTQQPACLRFLSIKMVV